MANRLRFRSGQVELHKVRVDSGTLLEAGDAVWLDTDDVKPASAFTWTTDLATTQANFANLFAGIVHQPSAVGETDPVSIDLSPQAVYEFDVVSDTYELGGLLGVDGAPSLLVDQRLAKVANSTRAIARAAEYKSAAATLLRVQFASALHPGSSNINAAVG